jgi:hypothetical protein
MVCNLAQASPEERKRASDDTMRRHYKRDAEDRAAAAPPLDAQQRQLLRKIVDELDAQADDPDGGDAA